MTFFTLIEAARETEVSIHKITTLVSAGILPMTEDDIGREVIADGQLHLIHKYGGERLTKARLEEIRAEVLGTNEAPPDPAAVTAGQDIQAFLSEVGPDAAKVTIFRRDKMRKDAYVDEIPIDDFSLGLLARDYGGGLFTLRLQDAGGRYIRQKKLTLEGAPKNPRDKSSVEDDSRAPVPSFGNSEMGLMMREFLIEMRRNSEPAANPMDMAVQMAVQMQQTTVAMVEAMRPAESGKGTSLKEMMELLQLGLEIGREGTGGGGGDGGMLGLLGGEVLSVLKSARDKEKEPLANAVNPPPEPTVDVPGESPWISRFRPVLPQLMGLAERGKDPTLYAEVILDQMPAAAQSFLYSQLETEPEKFVNAFYQAFPETQQFKMWFDRTFDELRALLVAEVPRGEEYEIEEIETADAEGTNEGTNEQSGIHGPGESVEQGGGQTVASEDSVRDQTGTEVATESEREQSFGFVP